MQLAVEARRRPGPPPSPRRARRAPGSASRARSGRRRRRRSGSSRRLHPAAVTHARTASWSFTPGSRSVERAESTAHGCTSSIAAATFAGPRPPASMTRPSVARARSRCVGSSAPHGRSTTVPTCSPSRRSTPSRDAVAVLAPRRAARGRRRSRASSPTKTATRRTVSGRVEQLVGPARALLARG